VIIFAVPYQFLNNTLQQIKNNININNDTIILSLIKGIKFDDNNNNIHLYSDIIMKELKLKNINVLMGANVASDVAEDKVIIIIKMIIFFCYFNQV
jgi:glycerol-3-phosphate dehydrogenase